MRDEQPLDDPLLGDFISELRAWGTEPAPVPSAALVALLADAEPDPMPPLRRKKMLVTKLATLGIAAKVALGTGVAAAAVTTAGAAGVLPDAAQHGVATVVNAISPLEIPDVPAKIANSVVAEVGDDLVPDISVPTTIGFPSVDDPTGDADVSDDAKINHGTCVSTVARDSSTSGREHGQAVSAVAQSDCGKDDDSTTSTSSTSTTSTTTTTIVGDESGELSENRGPGSSPGRGGGGGNGNGGSGNRGSSNG